MKISIIIVIVGLAFGCSNSSDSKGLSNTTVDVEKNVITVALEQGSVTFTNCFDLDNLSKKQIDSIAHIAAEEALVHIKRAEQIESDAEKHLETLNN